MLMPSVDFIKRETALKSDALKKDIVDLVHELSAVRDTQEVMNIVRHGVRRLLGADGATFVLRDGDYCYYAEEDAISPLWKGKRFPLETCISGWAMMNHESVVIEDIYQDSRIPHEAYKETFVHSLIMVPVRREDPVAAIGAYWQEMRKPEKDEVKTLEIIANAASVALTNVGLIHSLHGKIEELNQRNKELDLAYRAKASFLSTMSHELKTPLNVIMGFAEAIKRQIHGPVGNPLYMTYAMEIDMAGDKLLQIVNDVLELAAIGSGSYQMNAEIVRIDSVIETTIHLLETQLKNAELSLTTDIPERLPDVKGEPRLLKQIFCNILSNSVKFTPKGGKIHIAVKQDGDNLLCTITDSGIGMTAQDIEKAMLPFQQIDERLERRFDGIGLGLTLCKGYVDLHGGGLQITSTPDKGTVITVTLPIVS